MTDSNQGKPKNPYWQAALSLADAWGDDLFAAPLLKTIRRITRSVDAIQQLRADIRSAKHAGGGDAREFAFSDLGLTQLGTSTAIDQMIGQALPRMTSTKTVYTGRYTDLIEATLPSGARFWVEAYRASDIKAQTAMISEAFAQRGTADVVLDGLSEIIWDVIGAAAVELRFAPDQWGDAKSRLEPLPPADDYVVTNSGVQSMLEEVRDRARLFVAAGISRRILLYGPPGCGKTTLARHLTDAFDGRLVQINGRDVASHSGTVAVQLLSLLRPSLVLLDDLDRCDGHVEDLMGVLSRLDKTAGKPIVVVGTVNAIGQLDPALLRPGRFDEVNKIPEPDADYRRLVAKHYAEKFAASVDVDAVTEQTDGFAPADVRELLLSVGTVGPQVLDVELERVRRQRDLFAADACANYLSDRSNRPSHLAPAIPK